MHQLFLYVQVFCLTITYRWWVKWFKMKFKFELNPALGYTVQTTHTYTYRTHVLRVSSRERVSQEEQLHCSKEMLVASHPSWLIATQQICDRCFQIYYCPCWFATMDVQQLQRVYVVTLPTQYWNRVEGWQGELFEVFVGIATVPSSACTPWSRSGSTH